MPWSLGAALLVGVKRAGTSRQKLLRSAVSWFLSSAYGEARYVFCLMAWKTRKAGSRSSSGQMAQRSLFAIRGPDRGVCGAGTFRCPR